jgi:hypothetical protein
MDRALQGSRSRRCGGLTTKQLLVWAVILFGAYSAFKLVPVHLAKSNIKRAVESVIQDEGSHHRTDEGLKKLIARQANVSSIPLDQEAIQIERESRHGERVFHIAVAHPMTIDYLGSARTIETDVRVSQVVLVNEAAEEARAQRIREKEARLERERRINEQRQKVANEMWFECEAKHGKGNCAWQELPSSGSGHEFIRGY